ncbi:MAG: rRNA pseudouridine synthase [Ignavibacteriae bacterium]|nr:MAG: rRNA pseudouridine synthase [Ignavibacteriota bacterium]
MVRLNKYISGSGHSSRRKTDELISEGRVSVNGRTITELGTKINPGTDIIKVDGEVIRNTQRLLYILLNKPAGYITTTSDEKNRPTVIDLVKVRERIYPVGRLDYDTEGLLLLTNDGELANKLMHPKHEVEKTYLVKINRPMDEKALKRLTEGVHIEGKKTSKARVSIIPKTDNKQFRIIIHEGRNRQVRKMLEAVGLFVRKLKRIEYAGLNLKGMRMGEWRELSRKEILILKKNSKQP